MQKICLITPPSPFLLDERVFPALGILRVGAVLESASFQVDHLDLCGVSNYERVLDDYAGAEIFAITGTTPQIPAAVRIGSRIRERGFRTILGGPHSTLVHAAAKKGNQRAQQALDYLLKHFDTVVAGDGEKAIFTALHSRGLVDADDPKGILWNTSKDFTESPLPARHLIDMDSYHYSIDGAKATSMIAQLGCPFHSLTSDSFVFTSKGIERINQLQDRLGVGVESRCIHGESVTTFAVGEPVATRSGASDASVLLDEGIRPVFELRHKFGIPLRGTAEHPVLTVSGDALVWKRMDQIRKGDWIACKFVDPQTTNYVALSTPAQLRAVPPGGFHARQTPLPTLMDEDLAWLVGFILGDGCIPMDGRPQVHVCITDDIEERLRRIVNEKFNLEIKTYRAAHTDNMRHGWINSRMVYEFFVQTLGISPANKLTVPTVIRQSPASVIRAFLDGLWDADGHENKSSNFLTTVNDEFAREIAMLLLMTRRVPVLTLVRATQYRKGRCWRVGIVKAEKIPVDRSLYKSKKSGRWFWRTKKSPNRTAIRRRTLREAHLDHPLDIEGIFYSQVQSLTPIGEERVYDLTVPGEENFVANGIIVHNCKFCGGRNSPMLRQIRVRPSESVIDEMMHLHNDYGVSGIMHFQDELNVNHRGLVDLMRKIKDTGIDWQQRGFVKAELFNEEQAETMYAAGFRWLLCGFESAHPRILKNIAKNATREQNTNMLRLAHKHGIKVKALMSCGHPGESEETILATRDWLLEEKPDDFDLTIITVYPGTPYFDESECIGEPVYRFETNGDALYSENTDFHRDMQYYKGSPGEYKSYVWTDDLSREDICRLRDEVEAEVRSKLSIPYPSSAASINFESSMGMGLIPQYILRSTGQ